MMRVVVDTSVLVRYLIRPSAAIRALIEELWLGAHFQLVTAPELLAELRGVLERDYIRALIRPEEGAALLETICLLADVLPHLALIPAYTRDPKDDKFVACAIVGECAYIVTVDQDLLVLESLAGIRMASPEEFVAALRCETGSPEENR